MIREVVQLHEQRMNDRCQELDCTCRPLTALDADLVEWTLPPACEEGKYVSACLLLTDERRPLQQLADMLREVARQVELLTRPPQTAALPSRGSAKAA